MNQPTAALPFQPIRTELYTSLELMEGFDSHSPESYIKTHDFRTYEYFVKHGKDPYAAMMEALHDSCITQALHSYIESAGKPVVAIMGDHELPRSTPEFANIVRMARRLSSEGCLVSSGGGPGAMEATHLGALLVDADDDYVARAVGMLANVPDLPNSVEFDSATGEPVMTRVEGLHAWVKPAYEILTEHSEGGWSLGVPTWNFGSEPISPFARKVAKYFQSSIREDVLLSLAANGIIYTRGRSGTLQEVLQHAAHNFNRGTLPFAPMIFLDTVYWTETLPVIPLLHALFVDEDSKGNVNLTPAEFEQFVTTADTGDEAVNKLLRHKLSPQKNTDRMLALGLTTPV